MPRRPHLRILAALLVPAFLATSCGGGEGVAVDGFRSTDAAGCHAFLKALPGKVADQAEVDVHGDGSDLAAAWGDPAIVLRCGVGVPEDYDKFAACQRADGVDWFVPESTIEDQSADVVMTTIGRSPRVEVRVPASYRPSTAAMVDLATAIKEHTRQVSSCL